MNMMKVAIITGSFIKSIKKCSDGVGVWFGFLVVWLLGLFLAIHPKASI